MKTLEIEVVDLQRGGPPSVGGKVAMLETATEQWRICHAIQPHSIQFWLNQGYSHWFRLPTAEQIK